MAAGRRHGNVSDQTESRSKRFCAGMVYTPSSPKRILVCLAYPLVLRDRQMATTTRGNCWSVTINNPTTEDDECIEVARMRGWSVGGQPEEGEKERTPHYQLVVRTPQVRFSAVKKAFPRAHIELARNPTALEKYCHKEETRTGSLPTQSSQYPSLTKYWGLLYEEMTRMEKDNLDLTALWEEDVIVFLRESRQRIFRDTPLAMLDEYTRPLIRKGYRVEHHACNPQVRQQWKLFANDILYRTHVEKTKKMSETARQTDSVVSSETSVPVLTNADDTAPPPTAQGILGKEHSEASCASSRTEDEESSDEDC